MDPKKLADPDFGPPADVIQTQGVYVVTDDRGNWLGDTYLYFFHTETEARDAIASRYPLAGQVTIHSGPPR